MTIPHISSRTGRTKKTVLVIGDTGLLGQALLKEGYKLGLIMRGASRRSSDLRIDALDCSTIENALDTVQPDILINAAALTDINKCEKYPAVAWQLNARLPSLLASACIQRDIRFVHVSTDHFFTGDGSKPHDESSPVKLVNEYANSKYAGECSALTDSNALVVRTNIVGFRGWPEIPTFVEWLLDSLRNRANIPLYSDYYTSSIAASQFSSTLFNLLDKPVAGLFNLAGRQGASKLEFATALAEACNLNISSCRSGTIKTIAGVQRAESAVLDVGKIEAYLCKPLPTIKEVVQQLAFEYRNKHF